MNSGSFGATAWSVVSREGADTGNEIFGGDVGNFLWPQPSGFHNLRPPGAVRYASERVDEIAVAFSKGRSTQLYVGPLLGYGLPAPQARMS
jgi:hypothetical protein